MVNMACSSRMTCASRPHTSPPSLFISGHVLSRAHPLRTIRWLRALRMCSSREDLQRADRDSRARRQQEHLCYLGKDLCVKDGGTVAADIVIKEFKFVGVLQKVGGRDSRLVSGFVFFIRVDGEDIVMVVGWFVVCGGVVGSSGRCGWVVSSGEAGLGVLVFGSGCWWVSGRSWGWAGEVSAGAVWRLLLVVGNVVKNKIVIETQQSLNTVITIQPMLITVKMS